MKAYFLSLVHLLLKEGLLGYHPFFNILSFLKISSPSQRLNSAVEMQILKAVWSCGRHCSISLALACCFFPQVGRQLGIPLHSDSAGGHCSVAGRVSASASPPQETQSSDVVFYLPVPLLPSFNVMEVCFADLHGSVLKPCRGGSTVSHQMLLCVLHSISCIVTICVCFLATILKYTIKLTSKCFYSR